MAVARDGLALTMCSSAFHVLLAELVGAGVAGSGVTRRRDVEIHRGMHAKTHFPFCFT